MKTKTIYMFEATGLDIYDRRENTPENGKLVVKCQPRGCPTNGMMGHCFVEDLEGNFIGLVCVGSLKKVGTKRM